MLKTLFGRLATAKVALAAALAAAATGGTAALALTASQGSPHANTGLSVAAVHRSSADETNGSSETPEPGETEESSDSQEPPRPTETPSPSLVGLCHAYQAGAGAHQPRVLQNPAFSVLVNAAGGTDNLVSFCAELIGVPSSERGRPDNVPSHSHPGGAPGSIPSHEHPGGLPRSIPSHGHPSGRPTSIPSHSHP